MFHQDKSHSSGLSASPALMHPPTSFSTSAYRLSLSRNLSFALIAVAALLVVLGIWFGSDLPRISQPFGMDAHAWGSAHAVTIARSMIELGGRSLGIPMQNNLPLGASPDWYVHWPPLYYIWLATWLHIFGVTEAAARASALIACMAEAAALALVTSRLAGWRTAILAALALLCLPIFFSYSMLVTGLNTAVTLMLLSLWFFLRATEGNAIDVRFAWPGILFLSLAIFFSWEPLLLCPALLLGALLQRDRAKLRLAFAFLIAGFATTAAVMAWLLSAVPQMRADLLATIAYRAGLGYRQTSLSVPIHALVDAQWYTNQKFSWRQILYALNQRANALGPVAGLAVLLCFLCLLWPWLRRLTRRNAIASLVSVPYLLWWVFTPDHDLRWLAEFSVIIGLIWLLWPRLRMRKPAEKVLAAVAALYLPWWILISNHELASLAWFGVFACVLWLAGDALQDYRAALITVSMLALPYALWWLLLTNHAIIHDYQLMLFAPAAALATALVCASFAAVIDQHLSPRLAFPGAGLLVPLVALLLHLYSIRNISPDPFLQPNEGPYGLAIRAATPADAVVLSPSPSMVPVFYSGRHTIRLVQDDYAVAQILPEVALQFPHSSIYVAIPAATHLQTWGANIRGLIDPQSAFRGTIRACKTEVSSPDLLLSRCR